MDANERESYDGKSKPAEAAGERRAQKSFILHTDPFTMFQCALFCTMITLFCVVIPILQWISEWLRQP